MKLLHDLVHEDRLGPVVAVVGDVQRRHPSAACQRVLGARACRGSRAVGAAALRRGRDAAVRQRICTEQPGRADFVHEGRGSLRTARGRLVVAVVRAVRGPEPASAAAEPVRW